MRATLTIFLGLLCGLAAPLGATGPDRITVYRNAEVWNGSGFERRALAVRDGRFVRAPQSEQQAEVVDLSGKYVVPAYGNAHHHITNPTPAGSWTFIEEGVFYVWNPNSIVLGQRTLDYFATSDTVDVAFSQGGITEPRGHPEPLYVDTLSQYIYQGMTQKDFLGNAFHYGRDATELEKALDLLKVQKADFVKAYLVFGEQYEERRSDPRFEGDRGLNPANIPFLVSAARRRGLPAYFHVETRFDLMTAARAGAATIGHLPAYRAISKESELELMRLSADDARDIVRRGVAVVPTYGLAREAYLTQATKPGFNPAQRDRQFALQRDNLRLLAAAGATLLTGTDRNPAIFDEVEHWVAIGGMTRLAAVKATLSTGKKMFPDRQIGCFDPGCEADFLVLAGDPTKDLSALRRLSRIVKAGKAMVKPAGIDTGTRQATDG